MYIEKNREVDKNRLLYSFSLRKEHTMRVVKPLEDYISKPNDLTIFLAGSTMNCRDWQSEVIEELEKKKELAKDKTLENLVLFNPRPALLILEPFPTDDDEYIKQIAWENFYLSNCQVVSFYFCRYAFQDVPMFELGRHLRRLTPFFISMEDGFIHDRTLLIELANEVFRNKNDKDFYHWCEDWAEHWFNFPYMDRKNYMNFKSLTMESIYREQQGIYLHATPESHAECILDIYNNYNLKAE